MHGFPRVVVVVLGLLLLPAAAFAQGSITGVARDSGHAPRPRDDDFGDGAHPDGVGAGTGELAGRELYALQLEELDNT